MQLVPWQCVLTLLWESRPPGLYRAQIPQILHYLPISTDNISLVTFQMYVAIYPKLV